MIWTKFDDIFSLCEEAVIISRNRCRHYNPLFVFNFFLQSIYSPITLLVECVLDAINIISTVKIISTVNYGLWNFSSLILILWKRKRFGLGWDSISRPSDIALTALSTELPRLRRIGTLDIQLTELCNVVCCVVVNVPAFLLVGKGYGFAPLKSCRLLIH